MDIKKTISSITVHGNKDSEGRDFRTQPNIALDEVCSQAGFDENHDMYEHTTTYSLPLYTDDTPVDLRDGYNRAMVMIDRLIHQLETLIRETKGANQ